jgi:hypothetical protein
MTDQTKTDDSNDNAEEDFAEFESKVMGGEAEEGEAQAKPKPKADDALELGGEDAPEATAEQLDEEAKKTRSRPWQKRVDILTARAHDAERRAAEAEARLATGGEKVAEAKAPDPNDAKYEFGAADPDYIKDAALFEVRRELAKERDEGAKGNAEQAAKAEVVAKIDAGMAKVEATGAEKYDDFEEKIAAAVEARGGESLPPLLGIAITVSPVGADIAYRLATDEAASDRIERLAKTDPLKAAQAFGELEGEFTDDDDDLNLADQLDMARALGRMRARVKGNGVAVERKMTKAPKPAEHRARGGQGQFEVSDDTDDFKAFETKIMGRRK